MIVTQKKLKKSLSLLLLGSSILSSGMADAGIVVNTKFNLPRTSNPGDFTPDFQDGDTIFMVLADALQCGVPNGNIKAIKVENLIEIQCLYNTSIGSITRDPLGKGPCPMGIAADATLTLTGEEGDPGSGIIENSYSGVSFFGGLGMLKTSVININCPLTADVFDIKTLNINNNVQFTENDFSFSDSIINISANNSLTSLKNNTPFEGAINFSGANAVLNINGANSSISGTIQNGANGILNVNNTLNASNTSVGTIGAIKIAVGKALTNTAANSTYGGTINFAGANSTLNMNGTNGTISGTIQNGANGVFNINQNTIASAPTIGTIGTINIATGKALTDAAANSTYGGTINFAGANSTLNMNGTNGTISGTIQNGANGIFNINQNTIASAPTIGTIGTINIATGKSLTDTAANSTYGRTINFAGAGAILNMNGTNGTISGPITNGANGTLNVNQNVTANSSTVGTISAINIAAGAALSVAGNNSTYSGKVNFVGAGSSLNINKNTSFTKILDFGGQNGIINIPANVDVIGSIDSTVGSTGTVNFNIQGSLDGTIGATNPILLLNLLGNGTLTLPAIYVKAKTYNLAQAGMIIDTDGLLNADVTYSAAAKFTANDGMTGNVDFKNQAGTFTLSSNQTLAGDITSTGGVNGTVDLGGGDTVTGNISNIATLNFASGNTINIGGATTASNISIPSNATVVAAGLLTSSPNSVSFSGTGGNLTLNGGATANFNLGTSPLNKLTLSAGQKITGNITSTGGGGTLVLNSGSEVTGNIGSPGNKIGIVEVNGTGKIKLDGSSFSNNLRIGNPGLIVEAKGVINCNIDYTADGTVEAGAGIAGSVTTSANNQGTLKIGGGTVTGTVGTGTKALKSVDFVAGNSVLTSGAFATDFKVEAGANVTANGLLTGKVGYTGAGTLGANNGITGNIDFANQDGILNLASGKKITGNVDSTAGINGTLNFAGVPDVTGTIGAANALKLVSFNGSGAFAIPNNWKAKTFNVGNSGATITANNAVIDVTYSAAGKFIANGAVSNVDFKNKAGTFTLAANQTIASIKSTGGVNGTVNLGGGDTVTGDIEDITTLNLIGGGNIALQGATSSNAISVTTGANVTATGLVSSSIPVNFDNSGSILTLNGGATASFNLGTNLANKLTLGAGQTITGNITSTGGGGTLVLNSGSKVTGNIGSLGNNIGKIIML